MLRLRRYERISMEYRRFCSNGVSLIQNFSYKWSPSPIFFLSENWNEWSFMLYKNVGTSFFCFVTNQPFNGQTDSILMAIPCK